MLMALFYEYPFAFIKWISPFNSNFSDNSEVRDQI